MLFFAFKTLLNEEIRGLYYCVCTRLCLRLICIFGFGSCESIKDMIRTRHESSQTHCNALEAVVSSPLEEPLKVCAGLSLSGEDGQRTSVASISKHILQWFESGCIGINKSLVDLVVVTMSNIDEITIQSLACKTGGKQCVRGVSCCQSCLQVSNNSKQLCLANCLLICFAVHFSAVC
jgi:hypothetical protein